MIQYCNNKKCDKTHFARHRSRNTGFSPSEEKNAEGRFLCPAYVPAFKCKSLKNEQNNDD